MAGHKNKNRCKRGERKSMYTTFRKVNTCLAKYFGGMEITRNEVTNLLKNLLCATMDEIRELEESGEVPACLSLLIRVLFQDIDAGRFDAFFGIIDSVF
jgi:hypothetical protein